MPTHYHLLLRSMRGQLSPAVGWLQSEYARAGIALRSG